MATIKLGKGGYRGRPEGWVGDLGQDKNEELVRLGRAVWVAETKELLPEKPKRRYKTKKL